MYVYIIICMKWSGSALIELMAICTHVHACMDITSWQAVKLQSISIHNIQYRYPMSISRNSIHIDSIHPSISMQILHLKLHARDKSTKRLWHWNLIKLNLDMHSRWTLWNQLCVQLEKSSREQILQSDGNQNGTKQTQSSNVLTQTEQPLNSYFLLESVWFRKENRQTDDAPSSLCVAFVE